MTGAPSSIWSCSVDISGSAPVASLTLSRNLGTPLPFTIKGVCYSPCPINTANSNGPNLGDWFWDSYSGSGYRITDWSALWARDLGNIAAMGANTIRVYNMMSRQLNPDGSYPQPWNNGHLFTHQAFPTGGALILLIIYRYVKRGLSSLLVPGISLHTDVFLPPRDNRGSRHPERRGSFKTTRAKLHKEDGNHERRRC